VTERSLELFHGKSSRELVAYKDEFQRRAHVFNVEPGMGAYMPTTAPHWVKNGDGVSVTISVTYYTNLTRRLETLYRGNLALRELGLAPAPVGNAPVRDAVKHAAFRTYLEAIARARRVRGKPSYDNTVRYAPAARAY
jgi:hypothetical protein